MRSRFFYSQRLAPAGALNSMELRGFGFSDSFLGSQFQLGRHAPGFYFGGGLDLSGA